MGPFRLIFRPNRGGYNLKAVDLGVNFIDTAELYGTYPHIRKQSKEQIRKSLWQQNPMLIRPKGKKSLEKARNEMDIDVIDIFCSTNRKAD